MRIAYFDCFSGASGDMILSALLDAGWPADELRRGIRSLGLGKVTISAEKVCKQGFAATSFRVNAPRERSHRHLQDVRKIIREASLPPAVADRADRIFTRLAEAEARVHGTTIERVHFHEVGAVDAIVDIVGASLGIEALGVDRVVCSAIPTGSGTVRCEHGIMPVPAPGTLALLERVPLAECDERGELITPTGAAVLTTLAEEFGPLPAMTVEKVGYGAGKRDGEHRPNLLRLIVGRTDDSGQVDEVVTLQANLDDATGQLVGHVTERLFQAGALEVFTTPVGMKKGRPGTMITVLATPSQVEVLEETLFAETPTFGVRQWRVRRSKLDREWREVATPWGSVRIKLGLRAGRCISATPEYADCAKLAEEHGLPLRVVLAQANESASGFLASSAPRSD